MTSDMKDYINDNLCWLIVDLILFIIVVFSSIYVCFKVYRIQRRWCQNGVGINQSVAQTEQENGGLTISAAQSEQKIEVLKKHLSKSEQEKNGLKERLSKSEQEIKEQTERLVKTEQENEELKKRLARTEQEIEELEKSLHENNIYIEEELNKVKSKETKMKNERDEALRRLSELMSSRLRANNPNIVDLSDQFRPTKLAEISSELYDNEWTNAFDVIMNMEANDTEAIKILLDIVMITYLLCKNTIEKQWDDVIGMLGDDIDSQLRQLLIDKRKESIGKQITTAQMDVAQKLKTSVLEEKFGALLSTAGPVRVYMDACVKLCLHMVVQDPPVVWYCPGWTSNYLSMDLHCNKVIEMKDSRKEIFDKKCFRPYMKSGQFVEFNVWPCMLLHHDGPVLCKGVAQGCQ